MWKCFNKLKYTYIGINNDVSEENLITEEKNPKDCKQETHR